MNRPIHVLVLEDNPVDAELNLRELRRAGFDPQWKRVETEADFRAGLDTLPDLILADYSLPQFDGLLALKLVRERALDIPFILISGTVGEEAAVEAMKHGATDYLLKDRIARLGGAVERALEEKRLRGERKCAETALRESEQLLRLVMDLVPHHIFAKDANGRHLFANRACAEFHGLTTEQIVGLTNLDMVAGRPQAEDFMKADREVINSGQLLRIPEEPTTDLAGQTHYLQTIKMPFVAPHTGERAVLGVSVDITERKQAEAALRESEHLMRLVMDLVPHHIFAKGASGRYLFANRACAEFHGLTPEQIVGHTNHDLVAGRPEAELFMKADREVIASGKIMRIPEEPMTDRAGKVHFLQTVKMRFVAPNTGEPAVLGVSVEITERKQAEEALRQSEKQLATITNNIPSLISYVDRNLQYRFINAAYEKKFNLPSEKILGRSIRDLIGDDSFARVEPYSKRALAGERVTFENHICTNAGESFDFFITYVPDLAADGSVKGLFGMVTDISQLKQAQESLRKIENQLRQSQKMDAIGQLAGGVAHDFNNQLSVILGYSDILLQKIDEPNLRRFAERIGIAAKRSAELTQKLLVFSRKGQTETAPVDLHKILAETMEMLERSVDKRIIMTQVLSAESTVITGSASLLQNALLNLGLNARDAMPDGGTLIFSTENVILDSAFCNDNNVDMPPGKCLRLIVSDTGHGMSDEVKKHLFEPFYTTKAVGKGTGLGLASVYGTVKQHGGTLTVASVLGKGTCFSIYLPLADQNEVAIVGKSTTYQAIKGLRILLVEDEEIIRTMVAYMLTECGCDVYQAENGRMAVSFYQEHWNSIDLVILDMVMPELNGHDTFLAMKKINPAVKALLATGYSMNTEVQTILNDGVEDFLQKPFEPVQLQQMIAKIMSK